MKLLCCGLLLLICTIESAMAQVAWVKTFDSGESYGHEIIAGHNGQVYISGTFIGSVTFGGHTLRSKGDSDIFVACLAETGEIVWLKSFGSVNHDGAYTLATAYDGGVLVAGGLGGPATILQKKINGRFLALINRRGKLAWIRNSNAPLGTLLRDGTGYLSGSRLWGARLNRRGRVYDSWNLPWLLPFNHETGVIDLRGRFAVLGTSYDGFSAYVAYSENGVDWKWSTNLFQPHKYKTYPTAVTITPQGDVLATGSTPHTVHYVAYEHMYITRHSPDGQLLSTDLIGDHRGRFRGLAITSDADGNAYVAGYGQTDYLSRSTRFGAVIRGPGFMYRVDGISDYPFLENYARGICVDIRRRVYAIGDFQDFSRVGTNTLRTSGTRSVFVLRIDDAVTPTE